MTKQKTGIHSQHQQTTTPTPTARKQATATANANATSKKNNKNGAKSCHSMTTTSRTKKDNHQRRHHDNEEVKVGDVGYTFVKHFPGYGLFKGKVIKIRPNAELNKTRRCKYEDDDEEDLSLDELYALKKAEKKRQEEKKRYYKLYGQKCYAAASACGSGSRSRPIVISSSCSSSSSSSSSSSTKEADDNVVHVYEKKEKEGGGYTNATSEERKDQKPSSFNYFHKPISSLSSSSPKPLSFKSIHLDINMDLPTNRTQISTDVQVNQSDISTKTTSDDVKISKDSSDDSIKSSKMKYKQNEVGNDMSIRSLRVADMSAVITRKTDDDKNLTMENTNAQYNGGINHKLDCASQRSLPKCIPTPKSMLLNQQSITKQNGRSHGKESMQKAATENDGECCVVAKLTERVNTTTTVSSRTRKRKRDSEDIGEVGYVFTKMFPGYGLYNGMVVDILPIGGKNARNRRCVYTDGDSEDLTLGELKRLERLYPRSTTIEIAKSQDREVKSVNATRQRGKSDHFKSINDADNVRNQFDATEEWKNLDNVGEFEKASELLPPIDAAAEATIELSENVAIKKRKDPTNEDSHEDWLAEVASDLLKSTKGSKSSKKKLTLQKEETEQEARVTKKKSVMDIKPGSRFGCKVVNMKLSQAGRCIVGEVILEQKHGWLEVLYGEEIKRGRVGDFILVPDEYKVGERILVSDENNTATITSLGDYSQTTFDNSSSNVVNCINTVEPKATLASLFYWQCNACSHHNVFMDTACIKCLVQKNENSIPSALLEIAENAVSTATTFEEARKNIPQGHRVSIPKCVLMECFHKTNSSNVRRIIENPQVIANFFYWNCGFCTMQNSYKVHTCKCCSQKKNELAESSTLLKIASNASITSISVEAAIKKIPPIHLSAIPVGVLSSLVTCIATLSKDKTRRCLRAKVQGSDYCTIHRNPFNSPMKNEFSNAFSSLKSKNEDNRGPMQSKKNKVFHSVTHLKNGVRDFFRNISPNVNNQLKWNIACIEDAFLSDRNVPFALGLHVRRFFPGYGFHDGRITNIERKTVSEIGQERPVLLYRVEYNDGDREDLLHHEINSLTQLYSRTIVQATATANEHIPPGSRYETLLGVVEIKDIQANVTNRVDNGNILAQFQRKGQTTWAKVNLELTKLQLTVIRKISHRDDQLLPSPALEWPNCIVKEEIFMKQITDEDDNNKKILISDPAMFISKKPISFDYAEEKDVIPIEQQCQCKRPGLVQSSWDPVGAFEYLLFDPYDQTKCEVCKKGNNDHSILICDECNLGYHTYCLRPVVSTIPTTEWICPACSSQETGREGFNILVEELMQNFVQVSTFLQLPFTSLKEVGECFKDIFNFLSSPLPKPQRFALFGQGKKKTLTALIGNVHVNRKVCKHLWVLPMPQLNPKDFCHTFATMVAAFKYCGVQQYSEELVYSEGLSEEMNDASLDDMQKMSKDNSTIFRLYKENLKNGIYPPVEVVYDDELGFTVRALAPLPRHTILTEYVGEVTTIEKCNETSSDSLMILLETGDPKTSLIIDPTKISNIARFLSGVNNKSVESRRKANVRTRRFAFDGKSRVVLFTSRQIKAGESLNYDYNAGKEGKSMSDILNMGFYDTSNFF